MQVNQRALNMPFSQLSKLIYFFHFNYFILSFYFIWLDPFYWMFRKFFGTKLNRREFFQSFTFLLAKQIFNWDREENIKLITPIMVQHFQKTCFLFQPKLFCIETEGKSIVFLFPNFPFVCRLYYPPTLKILATWNIFFYD